MTVWVKEDIFRPSLFQTELGARWRVGNIYGNMLSNAAKI